MPFQFHVHIAHHMGITCLLHENHMFISQVKIQHLPLLSKSDNAFSLESFNMNKFHSKTYYPAVNINADTVFSLGNKRAHIKVNFLHNFNIHKLKFMELVGRNQCLLFYFLKQGLQLILI